MRVTVDLSEREVAWLGIAGPQRSGQLHLLESCSPEWSIPAKLHIAAGLSSSGPASDSAPAAIPAGVCAGPGPVPPAAGTSGITATGAGAPAPFVLTGREVHGPPALSRSAHPGAPIVAIAITVAVLLAAVTFGLDWLASVLR
jgi:hypothetical protein